MRTIYKLFIVLGFILAIPGIKSICQISINTDGSQPDPSAMLEVKSTSGGLLPPRMTTMQMNGISSPAAGLMVYNTTLNSICWFNGTSWDIYVNHDGQSCGTVLYGGKTYHSVTIGMQCWMNENLNAGTVIQTNQDQSNNGVVEKYCYGNDPANCDVYGGLYQWNEVLNYTPASNSNPGGRQGICPPGWHVPSDAEFCQLETYVDATVSSVNGGFFVGTDAGGKLKETGTGHWYSPNTGATNAFGFTALPGGFYGSGDGFSHLNFEACFWTSTEFTATFALFHAMFWVYAQGYMANTDKMVAFSVRCCKD
ncbi:MAG: fibrobacter succinogenes major paralogous domain-containing protein [Bacteroidota bacterium]